MTPDLDEAVRLLREAERELGAADPLPFPLPASGLEPLLAGSLLALESEDWWVPGLRERVGAVLRGVPITRLVDGFRGARPYRVAPPTPSTAQRALHAVGLAMASPGRCALVHLGLGSAADGAFHEALNLAALHEAPVVFVVASAPLCEDAPLAPQLASTPSALAGAHGIRSQRVDGSSARAVYDAVRTLRPGPALIEATLPEAASARTDASLNRPA